METILRSNAKVMSWLEKQMDMLNMLDENNMQVIDDVEYMNINATLFKTIQLFDKRAFDRISGIIGVEPTIYQIENSYGGYTRHHEMEYKGFKIVWLEAK